MNNNKTTSNISEVVFSFTAKAYKDFLGSNP